MSSQSHAIRGGLAGNVVPLKTAGNAVLVSDLPPLIKPGRYQLRLVGHETKCLFKRAKLYLWFEVMDFGEAFQMQLPRYYGVKRLLGRAGKQGLFQVGGKSAFIREYARLFGMPARTDRIPLSAFEPVIVTGIVRTVDRGHDQREIPAGLQYSVISELTGIAEGRAHSPSPAPSPIPPPPPT